jgi:hypothetical protein
MESSIRSDSRRQVARGRVRALLAFLPAAALVAAACQETPNTSSFTIRVGFDGRPGSFCETNAACSDYSLACGGRVVVRVFDVEAGAERGNSVCREVTPAETLCKMEVPDAEIFGVALHRVRISVALWRSGVLPEGVCPSQDMFDARGMPRSDFSPQPAFAGAAYFDMREVSEEVVVPLSCTDPAQLEAEQCQAAEPLVSAQVTDLSSGLPVDEEVAGSLEVGVGPVRDVPTIPGEQYQIEGSEITDLDPEGGQEPIFTGRVPSTMRGPVCTVVRDSGAESVASATCGEIAPDADEVELPGLLVTRERLDFVLGAMQARFPEEGLVIGRVFDHSGQPLAGAVVDGGPDAVVEYVDEEGTGLTTDATSSNGFFLSRDAPYGSIWHARHPDGSREQRALTGGLVRDRVTPILLPMTEPAEPTAAP